MNRFKILFLIVFLAACSLNMLASNSLGSNDHWSFNYTYYLSEREYAENYCDDHKEWSCSLYVLEQSLVHNGLKYRHALHIYGDSLSDYDPYDPGGHKGGDDGDPDGPKNSPNGPPPVPNSCKAVRFTPGGGTSHIKQLCNGYLN